MKHQAASLERLMENRSQTRSLDFKKSIAGSQKLITICSGKGGVGKSTFLTNLSIVLALLKKKVLVLDADLGLANLHILFNQRKTKDLTQVFNGKCSLKDIVVRTPYQVDMIFGGSGIAHLVELSEEEIWLFLDQLRDLQEYDYILIDVGAGVAKNVLSFLRIATHILLVTTPEPTALTDAYGLLKAFKTFTQGHYSTEEFFVVINKSISQQQSQMAMKRLIQTCKQYLGIDIEDLGYLPNDDYLVHSVYEMRPLVSSNPTCQFTKLTVGISKRLIEMTAALRSHEGRGLGDRYGIGHDD